MKTNKLKSTFQPIKKKFKYYGDGMKSLLIFFHKYNLFNESLPEQTFINGIVANDKKRTVKKLKEYAEKTFTEK